LVQGGSSSVGLFAVQLAKLIGYKVVATSSPHSFDLVKAYGADAVVDYHDVASAVAQIKQVTGGGVAGALECIGGVPNGQLAVDSIREGGGLVTSLIAVPAEIAERRADVKVERILMYTVFGYVSASRTAND
jgi:NADPH:quinone reductase-like Zn-dependent oxidoreductase